MSQSHAPSFPIALLLHERTCLVVGSGIEAAHRVRSLLAAGARVRVVAVSPDADLSPVLVDPRVEHRAVPYDSRELKGVWLVVLADRNAELAALIGADCEARRVFFCAIDQPGTSSFSHVAVARAGALTVAIGTEGSAPGLARRLKLELERVFAESGVASFVERVSRAREAAPPEERARVTNSLAARLRFTGTLAFEEPEDT